ncbi:MAG: hypothetical protein ACLQPH_03020 [Acidimicrobiales bacterium]
MDGDRYEVRTERSGRPRWLAAAALAPVVLLGAACGSSSSTSTTTTGSSSHTSSTTAPTTASSPVVAVASVGSLGAILVNHDGMTLYRYTPDGTGKSVCTGDCASTWPPLTVAAGTVHVATGAGVTSTALGTIVRPGGELQVTYRGMPLYTYVGDTGQGTASGQGLGGTWFVVPVSASSSTTTSTAAAGGHGY